MQFYNILKAIREILPKNLFQLISLFLGLLGSLMYATQLIFDWFGTNGMHKTLYSVITVIILLLATSYGIIGARSRHYADPWRTGMLYTVYGFVIISILVIVLNGMAMQMDASYKEAANGSMGFFEGFRMLTQVTQEDLNSLQNWALGLKQIVKALFLIVPFLICVWGGLSVLTADSLSDAEGGIMSVVAAFIVVIDVWLFKLVEVSLS